MGASPLTLTFFLWTFSWMKLVKLNECLLSRRSVTCDHHSSSAVSCRSIPGPHRDKHTGSHSLLQATWMNGWKWMVLNSGNALSSLEKKYHYKNSDINISTALRVGERATISPGETFLKHPPSPSETLRQTVLVKTAFHISFVDQLCQSVCYHTRRHI